MRRTHHRKWPILTSEFARESQPACCSDRYGAAWKPLPWLRTAGDLTSQINSSLTNRMNSMIPQIHTQEINLMAAQELESELTMFYR